MGVFLRKYGVAVTAGTAYAIRIPIIKRSAVDFAVSADWTPAAGDVTIKIDGGASANITTLPSAVTTGNGARWEFVFSAAELTGKSIEVTIVDAATKAIEDQAFTIETYGNASAMYQADFSAANLPADAKAINAVSTSSVTTVNANIGTTQPTNFTGTGASALVKGDAVDIGSTAAASATVGTVTNVTNGVTVTTNNDKTGYTASTVSDKTGYSLSGAGVTAVQSGLATSANQTTINNNVLGVNAIVTAIQGVLSGITSLAQWLGALAGKQTANATALNEIKSTGAGSGTFDPTTDSLEALGTTVDALSGITGSGAFTIAITVTDGTNPIENASVRMVSGGQHFIGTTDVSGHITFNLNAATWTVAITAVGFSFSGASLVVTGDTTHAYAMTAITITPSNPGLTTGFLTCYDQNGAVESGVTITATLVQAGSADVGHSYDNAAITKTSDVNGLVQFPNLILGATYRFTRGTSTKVYSITIPTTAGASYALPSIIGAP